MAVSNLWTLTYGGVTQTCAAWGISHLQRKRVGNKATVTTFVLDGAAVDSVAPFLYKQPIAIQRGGLPWFSGWVAKIPRKASPNSESISYELQDAIWYLENIVFQQMWASQNPLSGAAGTLITTTQSRTTIGQSVTGVSLTLGQVMTDVLYYALYAFYGLAFPTGTTAGGIAPFPAPPAGVTPPFVIGALTPSITEPFFQVTDRFCAEIIKLLLRFVPDVICWVDGTTTPPTLNIDSRANLATRTISVLNGLITSGFNPTPRPDLQVPAVIFKYEQNNTLNGTTYSTLTIDKFPLDAPDNVPFALVQTIDLLPGSATYQKQAVTVKDCPQSETDAVAVSWVRNNPLLYWLFGTASNPPYWDAANIVQQPLSITTMLDPNDPNNTTPQAGFALGALTEQLMTGAITDWMISDAIVNAAKVIKTIVLSYIGSDPQTLRLFNANPLNPNTLTFYIHIVCTNAQTKTYQQLTSIQEGEPVPVGNAEAVYTPLSVLHQEGTIELTEPECSDMLPIGCVFNATDGLAEWQDMDALVIRVDEDIDNGKTKVEFGPMVNLSGQDLVELQRANRGRLPSSSVGQRTTGKAGADGPVIGHSYSPEATLTLAPGSGAVASAPWGLSFTKTGAQWQAVMNMASFLQRTQTDGDTIPVSGLGTLTNINPAGDFAYLECTVTDFVAGTASIKFGSGGGSFNAALPAWDSSNNAYLANDGATPPNQTYFRVLLAKITPDANGNPVATPECINDLLIFNVLIGGFPALVAYPSPS